MNGLVGSLLCRLGCHRWRFVTVIVPYADSYFEWTWAYCDRGCSAWARCHDRTENGTELTSDARYQECLASSSAICTELHRRPARLRRPPTLFGPSTAADVDDTWAKYVVLRRGPSSMRIVFDEVVRDETMYWSFGD